MSKFALVVSTLLLAVAVHAAESAKPAVKPSLKEELAKLKVPPDWFAATQINWDMNKPWKDARLEVRRLLGMGQAEVNQAVKITYLYAQKGDIGNGHELPMYLFMSGNYAWAVREYPPHLKTVEGKGATHEYLCYASCLTHFGEYDQATKVLEKAMQDISAGPWKINSQATIHSFYGDMYAEMGDIAQAKTHYAEAIRLYPLSNQPVGRQVLNRNIARIQTKLDLLTLQSLQPGQLRDGTYIGRSMGYVDKKEMEIALTVKGGRMADIKVKHEEKIELNATQIIPQRIIEKQSLKVDNVTGATVTSQAIIDGTLQAMKQAGLK